VNEWLQAWRGKKRLEVQETTHFSASGSLYDFQFIFNISHRKVNHAGESCEKGVRKNKEYIKEG